jgi:hypothetical protein
MQPVFGIDFDGVICDTIRLKQGYLKEQWGFSINPWEANRTYLTERMGVLSNNSYDLMLEAVCSRSSTLSARPIKGAPESLEKLSEEGTIYVLTARKGVWLTAVVEWMVQNGLDEHVEGYISSKLCNQTKLKICERIGMTHLVEDDPGYFDGLMEGVVGVIIDHGCPDESHNNGVKYARDWSDAMRYLL